MKLIQETTMGLISNLSINSTNVSTLGSFSKLAYTLLAILVCAQTIFQAANGHGIMVDPVARNSLWRIDGSAPKNYDDTELFCGGIGVSIPGERSSPR